MTPRQLVRTVDIVLTEPQLHDPGSILNVVGTAAISPLRRDHTDADAEAPADDESAMAAPLPEGRARCSDGAGTLASLFFSDEDFDVARAKAICRNCAVSDACLEGALERREAYGVWGGVLLIDGEPVRFARRRGRPPVERIEVVAEEVPVPEHLVA